MESNQSNQSKSEVVTRSKVVVESITKGQFSKPGFMQAQLRQVVTTDSKYPSARVGNSLSDTLFSIEEFPGVEMQNFTNTENRLAWVGVPEGTTVEKAQSRIPETACIYKILSHSPILTEEQKSSIDRGQKSMDDFATSQAVRYPDNHATNPGALILKDGKIQYRATFYSKVALEDQDLRTNNASEYYAPAELLAELQGAGVIAGQEL